MTKFAVTTYYFDYTGSEVNREEEELSTPEAAFTYMGDQVIKFNNSDPVLVYNDAEGYPEESPSKGEVIARFRYAPAILVDDDDEAEIYMELSLLDE